MRASRLILAGGFLAAGLFFGTGLILQLTNGALGTWVLRCYGVGNLICCLGHLALAVCYWRGAYRGE
jgi:hypothetical protein